MTERRRLFFGIWPDRNTRDALVKIQQELSARKGRLTYPDDLHLTLNFLGSVDAERQSCVEAAAERVTGEPFEIRLERTGFWSRSRIFWCGPLQTPAPLAALFESLQRQLLGCRFEPEQRPYKAHITLMRDAPVLPSGPLDSPAAWICDRFVLAESLSVPRPQRYRILREWQLGGS